MEVRVLVGSLALLAGFTCLFSFAMAMGRALGRRRAVLAAQGEPLSPRSFAAWRLRNGYPAIGPVVQGLMKIKAVDKLLSEAAALASRHGLIATPESAGTVLLAALCAVSLAAGLLTLSPVALIATFACAMATLLVLSGNAADKRLEEVREAVPEALESMAACVGSGFTLLQTLKQVSQETPGPLGKTFARSAHVLEVGGTASQALAQLQEGAHASELAFVAVALDVQHESGGAMKQVLDAATESVKGELALQRSLRVQTAQAKLSARIVVVMPFILVAAFSLMSPDFLMPFFSSLLGYALLGVAIVMQAAGIILVRRALAVEGVS